jgi:hypothetical protein
VVWCEEEECLFIFGGDKSKAISVNCVEVFEVKELLVCFGYECLFLFVQWELGDLSNASMDGDEAGGLSGCQENCPGFVTETVDEGSFCFFGVMLEKGRVQAKVLL